MRTACEALCLPPFVLHSPAKGFRAWEWQGYLYFSWPGAPLVEPGQALAHDGRLHQVMSAERTEDGAKGKMLVTTGTDFMVGHWSRHKLPMPFDALKLETDLLRAALAGEEFARTEDLFKVN